MLKLRLAIIACLTGRHFRKIRAISLQEELAREDVVGADGQLTAVDTRFAPVLLASTHVIQMKWGLVFEPAYPRKADQSSANCYAFRSP